MIHTVTTSSNTSVTNIELHLAISLSGKISENAEHMLIADVQQVRRVSGKHYCTSNCTVMAADSRPGSCCKVRLNDRLPVCSDIMSHLSARQSVCSRD